MHTEKTLITYNDVKKATKKGYKQKYVSSKIIITPLAQDIIEENGIKIIRPDKEKKNYEKETFAVSNKRKIAILSN